MMANFARSKLSWHILHRNHTFFKLSTISGFGARATAFNAAVASTPRNSSTNFQKSFAFPSLTEHGIMWATSPELSELHIWQLGSRLLQSVRILRDRWVDLMELLLVSSFCLLRGPLVETSDSDFLTLPPPSAAKMRSPFSMMSTISLMQ